MKKLSALLLALSAGVVFAQAPYVPAPVGIGSHQFGGWNASRSQVIARHGMAATSNPLATGVAVQILREGGSAVDAAIAASAVLGLVEPLDAGIGGDVFASVWDPHTHKLVGLNASGGAPAGLSLAALKAKLKNPKVMPFAGSATITVPGAVAGWFALHERFGRLPMARLLQPAITYAREGFAVSQEIADYWQYEAGNFAGHAGEIEERDNYRRLYWPGGKPPREGQIFRNPDLAHSLQLIAEGGRDVFYRGAIAGRIDAYMQRVGGALRRRDLENYRAEWVEPVCTDYRGYDVCELPPNTQGIAVLQMLNILRGFPVASLQPGSAELLHLEIEAKRLVYEDMARYYADPRFAAVPVAQLLSKEYADARRKLILPDKAMPSALLDEAAARQKFDPSLLKG